MTDYTAEQIAAMSDDELRRVIAEMLGWSEIEEYDYWYEDYGSDGWITTLRGTHKGESGVQVPNWPTDANAALALVEGVAESCELETIESGWRAALTGFESPVWYFASSKTPARAVCAVWVQWKQAQP